MISHEFEVFADYNQFYVWDGGLDRRAPENYTDEDVRRMVKVAPNVVVIQPVRNMTVPVRLEVHEADPGFVASEWDHVVECSLDLPTGHLQVEECTGGTKLNLRVPAGSYRVRALFGNLDSLSDDGLNGDDRYCVVLWRGLPVALEVVKQWAG